MTRRAFYLPAWLLLAVCALMQIMSGNAGDKNWLLFTAGRWLEGRRLYVDLVNPNVPLIVWLYAIPAWIAAHLPFIAGYIALGSMGIVCVTLTVWLSLYMIRRHPAFASDADAQNEFALLLAYVLIFFVDTMSFFDRDDIFLIFSFPYLMRFLPSLARMALPLPLRLVVGFLAALGFCVKPYTVVVFLAVQLLTVIRERSPFILFSVENGVIYAVGLAYVVWVYFFMPPYAGTILPMLMLTYSACSRKGIGVFYDMFAVFYAALMLVDFRTKHVTPYRRDIYYLLSLCPAFYLYTLVNNGWYYTYKPMLCMLLFTCGWLMWEHRWLKRSHTAQGLPVRSFVYGERACTLLLLGNIAFGIYSLPVFFASPAWTHIPGWKGSRLFVDYVNDHHIRSFGTISMDFDRWTVLTQRTGASWDTRFNHLWMLPQLVKEGEAYTQRHAWIVDYVGKSFAQDMNQRKPDIIIVDNSEVFYRYYPRVDLLAFFGTVPQFKDAWRNYRYDTTIDTCNLVLSGPRWECRFDIYSRIKSSPEKADVPHR